MKNIPWYIYFSILIQILGLIMLIEDKILIGIIISSFILGASLTQIFYILTIKKLLNK